MWIAERRKLNDRAGEILSITDGARATTTGDVIALWRDDAAFRDFFIATLAASPCEAFFWEMPPVDSGALAHPFECAILRSDALARIQADDADFEEHLRSADLVAVFENLGGDALLIAPTKIADANCYGHIASFVRMAPHEQQRALFQCIAPEIEKRIAISRERFWVSTSGLGVPWIHVRLDRRPKYYQYAPYR